jgi:hypothetical protein
MNALVLSPRLIGTDAVRSNGNALRFHTEGVIAANVGRSMPKKNSDTSENRNQPETLRWRLGAELHDVANELMSSAQLLTAEARRDIETPFPDACLPTEDDIFWAGNVVSLIADAVTGVESWTALRSAFEGATRRRVRIQERQALALKRCTWALRNRKSASGEEWPTVAKALIAALREQHSGFGKLSEGQVAAVLAGRPRKNASSRSLLIQLSLLARVWTELTDAALKAVERKFKEKDE